MSLSRQAPEGHTRVKSARQASEGDVRAPVDFFYYAEATTWEILVRF